MQKWLFDLHYCRDSQSDWALLFWYFCVQYLSDGLWVISDQMQVNYEMYFKNGKVEDVRKAFLYKQLPAGWICHQNTTSGKLPVLSTPCTLPHWEFRRQQKVLNGATWTVVMQFYWFFTYKNPMIFYAEM